MSMTSSQKVNDMRHKVNDTRKWVNDTCHNNTGHDRIQIKLRVLSRRSRT